MKAGQALGRLHGRFTTKIHGKADDCGDLIACDPIGGEAPDCSHFATLLDIGQGITPHAAIADNRYSAKADRSATKARGIAPVVPTKPTKRAGPPSSPKRSTKGEAASSKVSDASNASGASPCDARKPPKSGHLP